MHALDIPSISKKNITMFSESGAVSARFGGFDGSLRVAELTSVANHVPFCNLCMFRNDRAWPREERFAA